MGPSHVALVAVAVVVCVGDGLQVDVAQFPTRGTIVSFELTTMPLLLLLLLLLLQGVCAH